jgi:hypothetical protein
MNVYKIAVLALVVLVFLALVPIVVAQYDDVNEPTIVVVNGEESVAWGILQNLAIAGFPLAGLGMLIVQLIKAAGDKFGLIQDGQAGYIAIVVACVLTAVAIAADIFNAQAEVAGALQNVERVIEAMITFAGSVGWFKVAQTAQLVGTLSNKAE